MAQIDRGEDSEEMPFAINDPDKVPKYSKKRKEDQIEPQKSSKKSRSESPTSSRQKLIDENQSDTGDLFLLGQIKNWHFVCLSLLMNV